jgi:hypothetical protein
MAQAVNIFTQLLLLSPIYPVQALLLYEQHLWTLFCALLNTAGLSQREEGERLAAFVFD